MSFDTVPLSLAVNVTQEAQDKARRNQQREGNAKHHDKEEQSAHPVPNPFGEMIGKTIDVTA